MKIYTKILISLALFFPLISYAVTVTWQSSSTTNPVAFPTAINGVTPSVTAPSFTATSSTATSTLPIISSSCVYISGKCIGGNLIASTELWIDANRTDTYTANGSIQYPFKTIETANTYVNSSSTILAQGVVYHIAPAYYYLGEFTLNMPNTPMTVYATKATVITAFGAGNGSITFPNQVSWNGGSLLGFVNVTDTSTSTPHSFENDFAILGNVTCSGLCTFLNGVILPFSNRTYSTITLTSGSLMNDLGMNNVANIVVNGGTLNLNNDQVIASTTGYAVTATTPGSVVEVLGLTLVNPSGGGINVQNGATIVPNNLGNIIITDGVGATPIISNATTTTILNGYTAYSVIGQQQYAVGSGYIASNQIGLSTAGGSVLGSNVGGIPIGTTTIDDPFVASSTFAETNTATSTFAGGISATCFSTGSGCITGGAGSQTPWLSAINGNDQPLSGVSSIYINNAAGVPTDKMQIDGGGVQIDDGYQFHSESSGFAGYMPEDGSFYGELTGNYGLIFKARSSIPVGSPTEQMRLVSGKLGIGTSTPATTLDVNGAITSETGGIQSQGSATSTFAGSISATTATFKTTANNGAFDILDANQGSSAVVFNDFEGPTGSVNTGSTLFQINAHTSMGSGGSDMIINNNGSTVFRVAETGTVYQSVNANYTLGGGGATLNLGGIGNTNTFITGGANSNFLFNTPSSNTTGSLFQIDNNSSPLLTISYAGTSTFAHTVISPCFATSTAGACITGGGSGGGVTSVTAGYGLNVTPTTGNVTAALNLSSYNNWNVLQTFPQIELNSNGGSYTPYSTFQMDYNAGGEVGGNLGKFTIGSDSGSWGQLQEYSPNAGEVSNVFCSECIQNGDGTLSNVNGDNGTTFAFGVASFDGNIDHFNIGSNGTGGVVFAVDGDTENNYDSDAGMILLPNQNNCNGPTDALSTDGIGGVFCNTSLSDQRLKKNIISLDASSSLAKLMLLNPVAYNWNKSYYTTPTGEHDGVSSTTQQLGLLAQQVQTLFPSLVQGTTSTSTEVVLKKDVGGKVIGTTTEQVQNYLSVDYVHMIPVLISAIQEQQAEIKQLQAEIASTTR